MTKMTMQLLSISTVFFRGYGRPFIAKGPGYCTKLHPFV